VDRRIGQQRRQRWVQGVDPVPQSLEKAESRSIASGGGHRQPPCGQENGLDGDGFAAIQMNAPPSGGVGWLEPLYGPREVDDHPRIPSCPDQRIPDIPGPVGTRKELPGFWFKRQRDPKIFLEKCPLGIERPREQDLPQGIVRGVGHIQTGVELGWQDIAPPASADEDLSPPVTAAFDQSDAPRSENSGRHDGSHEPSSARTDNDEFRR
jgi:hypothetical protein